MPGPSELERMSQELAAVGEPDFLSADMLNVSISMGDLEVRIHFDREVLEAAVSPQTIVANSVATLVVEIIKGVKHGRPQG